jgi:hypothetical protein
MAPRHPLPVSLARTVGLSLLRPTSGDEASKNMCTPDAASVTGDGPLNGEVASQTLTAANGADLGDQSDRS